MIASNKNLEDVILRTIDIIASQKIAKAGYDKTIQATVVSCIDETTGKYKVKYQDSYWVVYSSNPDVYYTPNTNVYVLIPGGDLSKDKTILGTTKRLGASYVPTSDIEKRLCPVGTNVANSDMIWSLCSYKTETKILYSSSFSDQQNLLNIDKEAAIEYIRNATSIIAGAYIKNNLDTEQRYRGNYGILFGLDFMDTATNQIVTRYYSIDVDNMSGNPYYYPNEVQQYENFDIDESNFVEVNTIAIFTKDFPNQSDDKPDDIFISKIELSGAISLQDADLEASALVLLSPKGYIFTEDSLDTDERILKAQVRNQGKVIDAKSQKIEFYWFIENLSITTGSSKYNRYGGQGWECLNNYEIVQPETINNGVTVPAVLSFSPGDDNFSIKKSQVFAKTTRYKCVAIYNNTVLGKEAKIVRNDSQYDIQVSSTKGTQFYNNAGITDLICDCKQRDGNIVDPDTLKFVWAVINNVGNFNSLPTTVEYNDELQKLTAVKNAINKYLEADWILYQTVYDVNRLLPNNTTINSISDTNQKTQVTNARLILINAGLITTNDINTLLNKNNVLTTNLTYSTILNDGNNSLTKAINNYDKIQRVINNKVTGIPINSITNFSTFKCSVFTKTGNIFLGSGSITLLNFPEGGGYNLVIENGTQVFKYNTHGVSPASQQKENPLTIPALTFTIYDNMGNKLEDNVVKNVKTTWTVPSNNTLLKTNYNNGIPDSALQTVSYKNLSTFVYAIAENYNVNYTRNDIELKVQYNGLTLYAKTNLSFLKQGDSSTNGTDFVCKIIPNVTSGNIPVNPIIYYNSNKTVSFNWNVASNNQWFKAQLWHNGNEPIFEGINSGDSLEGKLVTIVKWEVLKNIYTSNKMDKTNLEANMSNNNWSFKFNAETYSQTGESNISNNYLNWRPANIIKVTLNYDGMTYYATLPVITCRLFVADYKVELKDHTGFRQVLYDASGQFPKYDSHAPFEILTFKKVNNNWEDISNKNSADLKLKYDWYYLGSVFNRTNSGWEEEVETTNLSTGESSKKWLLKDNLITQIESNKKAVRPVDSYNGECVNIALACRIYLQSNSTTIAWIHIPIHMLRNRFENSAINGWDGNSVNLGGSNGGMILAPQAGVGVKDSNNRFTGVFIGTSKDPNADSSSAVGNIKANEDVGLFGYNKGSRSIFLDAKTGKAVFGEKEKSQIILDPANDRAEIKSGNYSTTSKTGMMIDLTTPEIKFGSGNFSVNRYGEIIAKGNGEIAGWKIDDSSIFSKRQWYGSIQYYDQFTEEIEQEDLYAQEGATGMNSVADPSSDNARVVDVPLGKSNTEPRALAFWAGNNNFYVTHDGILRITQAIIGSPFSQSQNLIYIDYNKIHTSDKKSLTDNGDGFYIGLNGISLGPSSKLNNNALYSPTVSNFQVTYDGTLYARKGYIGNGQYGWEIGSNYLRNNKTNLGVQSNSSGVYLGTNGIALGSTEKIDKQNISKFQVDSSGRLYAREGYIGDGESGWEIGPNCLWNGKEDFSNDMASAGIYIGTDGIALGTSKDSDNRTWNGFSVSKAGNFHARKGTIHENVTVKGKLTAGQIDTGTVNDHKVEWQAVDLVSAITVLYTRVKVLTSETTTTTINNIDLISWLKERYYLLVEKKKIPNYDGGTWQQS